YSSSSSWCFCIIDRPMEVLSFALDGQRYGFEEAHAYELSKKLRAFAAGGYRDDVSEIASSGLEPEWLTRAASLADRVDQWLAEERADAILLERGGFAEPACAVISRMYSDGWDSQQVSELRTALGRYLGL